MSEFTDHELLADFVRTESEDAFGAIVTRHVNLVYATARRSTGNSHHAEEITQAVFVILTRKAATLPSRVVLSGWLYQTTRFTAANFMKAEIRRQQREQEAYMQSTLKDPGSETWQRIAPLLEDAMGRLGETDRNAVILRFFENKTAAEAATVLNLTEAATHKRTNRALDKLRKIFSKHGLTSSTSILAGAISAHSIHLAPAGVITSVKLVAAAKGAAVSSSIATVVQGVLKTMAWTKTKTSIAVGIGVLLTASTTFLLLKEISRKPDLTALQGTWVGQETGIPGQATIVINGLTLEFRGADSMEWYKGTFSLLKNTNPRQVAIVIADCPDPEYVGKTARAIFKLEGDTFTVAGNEPGNPSLPASFDSPTAVNSCSRKNRPLPSLFSQPAHLPAPRITSHRRRANSKARVPFPVGATSSTRTEIAHSACLAKSSRSCSPAPAIS
jgi:RNA polymerase sigma factor (sigma-70 family)